MPVIKDKENKKTYAEKCGSGVTFIKDAVGKQPNAKGTITIVIPEAAKKIKPGESYGFSLTQWGPKKFKYDEGYTFAIKDE